MHLINDKFPYRLNDCYKVVTGQSIIHGRQEGKQCIPPVSRKVSTEVQHMALNLVEPGSNLGLLEYSTTRKLCS